MSYWLKQKSAIQGLLVWMLLASVIAFGPFAAHLAAATPELDAALDVDVVGLRLGMTPEEVMAVIAAYNPDLSVSTVSTDITMRDSHRENITLASYLGEIRADGQRGLQGWQRNDHQEHIAVLFSSPPAAPRAIQIRRHMRYLPGQGPGYLDVVAAIDEKYGQATYAEDNDQSARRFWQYDGWRLSFNLFGKWYGGLGILDQPPPAGKRNFGSVDAGRSLGVLVTNQKGTAYVMNFVLTEGLQTINAIRDETSKFANAALDEHETKLQTQSRSDPPPL